MCKSPQAGRERTRRKRILIVEDDPILGDLLLEALQEEEEEAYEASHVLSGEMAQSILQTDAPALVLLDYHLPGMNGLELADWLRSREKLEHIPILLMSADTPQEVSGKSTSERCRNLLNWKRCCKWSLNCSSQGQRMIPALKKRSPTAMVLDRTIVLSACAPIDLEDHEGWAGPAWMSGCPCDNSDLV